MVKKFSNFEKNLCSRLVIATVFVIIAGLLLFLCSCSCSGKSSNNTSGNIDAKSLKASESSRQLLLIAVDPNNHKKIDISFKDTVEKKNQEDEVKSKLESELGIAYDANEKGESDVKKDTSMDYETREEADSYDGVEVYSTSLTLDFEPSIEFGLYRNAKVFGFDNNPNIPIDYKKIDDEILVNDSASKYYGQLVKSNMTNKDGNSNINLDENCSAFELATMGQGKDSLHNKFAFICCNSNSKVDSSLQIPKENLLSVLYHLSNNCSLVIDYKENIQNY